MATTVRFNPPPGWPPAAEGWLPEPGWNPDPGWPPSPPGWNFYIKDSSEKTRSLDLGSNQARMWLAIGGSGGCCWGRCFHG